jgi:hypothetical protein
MFPMVISRSIEMNLLALANFSNWEVIYALVLLVAILAMLLTGLPHRARAMTRRIQVALAIPMVVTHTLGTLCHAVFVRFPLPMV